MLVKPLEKYFQKPTTNYNGSELNDAIRRVGKAFYVGKLKAIELEKVSYDPLKSAGAPTFRKKHEVNLEELKRARRIRRGEAPPPVTVFHRGKNDEVCRPVFGYPFAMTLLEGRFFEPYQFEVMNHHNPYVGGRAYPQLAGEMNELAWKSDYVVELDYSGFDGSIPAKLIYAALDIIANNFDMSEEDTKDWNLVVRYFATCPVLLPSGRMVIGKRHGVPSGSMFTQLVDSIVNAICIEYATKKAGIRYSRYHVLGDDSVIGVCGPRPSIKRLGEIIEELGCSVNFKKSRTKRASARIYFLGHYWRDLIGVRDVDETWERLLTPEKPDDRFFSKEIAERRKAMVERMKDYQNDNPDMFGTLQVLIMSLEGRTQINDVRTYAFNVSNKFAERVSWDIARGLGKQPRFFERAFSRHLYHLSGVTSAHMVC
jgi:hypothetical protein